MDQKSDYKLNINKLMTLTNFEYQKSKSNPPGFHLERVEYMMKKFDYPNKNQVFIPRILYFAFGFFFIFKYCRYSFSVFL